MCRLSQVSSLMSCSGGSTSWSTAAQMTSFIQAAIAFVSFAVSVTGSRAGRPLNENPSSELCSVSKF